MSDMGFTPNLAAGGNIRPFRFVTLSAAFTASATTAITESVIGVTDGSVYQQINNPDNLHAVTGTSITLQPTNTVQVEVGGNVAAGDYLMPDPSATVAHNGRAVLAAGATAVSNYIALENGVAGNIIRAYRFGQRGPVFS